jgi:hypothetical protein
MNFDYEPSGDDQELIRIWQQNLPPAGIDPVQIVQEMSCRISTEQFGGATFASMLLAAF